MLRGPYRQRLCFRQFLRLHRRLQYGALDLDLTRCRGRGRRIWRCRWGRSEPDVAVQSKNDVYPTG